MWEVSRRECWWQQIHSSMHQQVIAFVVKTKTIFRIVLYHVFIYELWDKPQEPVGC